MRLDKLTAYVCSPNAYFSSAIIKSQNNLPLQNAKRFLSIKFAGGEIKMNNRHLSLNLKSLNLLGWRQISIFHHFETLFCILSNLADPPLMKIELVYHKVNVALNITYLITSSYI